MTQQGEINLCSLDTVVQPSIILTPVTTRGHFYALSIKNNWKLIITSQINNYKVTSEFSWDKL